MKFTPKDKAALLKLCLEKVDTRIAELQQQIDGIQESRTSDTKSSAGDKFETSREMLQQEENNINKQLIIWGQMRRDFNSIDLSEQSDTAGFGSLISASNGFFFLSGSLGKVKFKDQTVFCISLASPMGGLMNGRSEGELLHFNDKEIKILKVQ